MKRNRQEVIDRIRALLNELADDTPADQQAQTPPTEMLTVRECTEAVRGISAYTVRKLVEQGHIRYIRTGESERGKILISKQSLLDYLGGGK